jgi:probable rRNA maturation factor
MIEILNQQRRHRIRTNRFRELLKALIERYALDAPEVTVAFVNNKAIRELNRKFMKKNAPTDVLSFPLGEKGADGKFYLGDIIISVPQAFKQAKERKQSLERELEILTVHGFLHLMGFEHQEGMEEEEYRIKNFVFEGKNGN